MTTELFREDTGIHHTKILDTVDAALRVNHARGRRWAHACRSNGVIKGKRLLLHETYEIIIRNLGNVAGGVWPPV